MIEDRRRVISFSYSPDRISFKVFAENAHPVRDLPVREPFHFRERNVPTRERERFAYGVLLAELRGDGAELQRHERETEPPRDPLRTGQASEPVDPRDMLELVKRHNAAGAVHLTEKIILHHCVAGKFDAVPLAPIVKRACERVGVKVVYHPPPVKPYFFRAGSVEEQGGDLFSYRIAVPLLEFRFRDL